MQVADWIPVWQRLPYEDTQVAVLVVLSNGSLKPDIGIYRSASGWSVQFWSEKPRVTAWVCLPNFYSREPHRCK